MSSCISQCDNGIELRVKVVPGASRDRIVGMLGDSLKVQVSAAPERGKANAAVAKLLADRLGVSTNAVTLVCGAGSPQKVFAIHGVSSADAAEALGLLH